MRNKSLIQLPDRTEYVVGINIDITEQKKIAREVEHQRQFLQEIINTVPHPFYVKDRQHRWVLVNKAFSTLFAGSGEDPDAFLGKSDIDFRDPVSAARAWEEDELCLREPGIHNFEDTLSRFDGTDMHLLKTKVALRLSDDELFVVGFNTDVTERRRATLEIERSREFLKAIVETLPNGIWIKDQQRRYVLVNDWEARRLGISVEKVLGKITRDIFDEEQARVFDEEDDAVYSSSAPLQFEIFKPASAEESGTGTTGRWYLKTKALRTLPDGSRYLVGTISDVTNIKLAELAARHDRQFLEAIIDAVPYPMYVKDADLRWVMVNEAGAIYSGTSRESLMGRTDTDVFGQDYAVRIAEEDRLCMYSEEPVYFEDLVVDVAGHLRYLLKTKSSITLADGSRYLVGLNTDVSSLKRTENELVQSQRRLRLLNSIASAMTTGQAMETVVHFAMKELAALFPDFRWAYSERVTDQRIRVLSCASGNGMPDISGHEYEFDKEEWDLDAFRDGKMTRVDDTRDFRHSKLARNAESQLSIRARLMIPLVSHRKLIGVVSAASFTPHPWSELEVNVARDVAEYLTVGWNREHADIERHVVARALAASEIRLKSVIESAAEGIVIMDAAGIMRMVNPAVVDIFGYGEKELLGEKLTLLIPHEDGRSDSEALDDLLMSGEPSVAGKTVQMQGRRRNGTKFPVDLLISATVVDGATLFTGLLRDITERVRIEQELHAHRDNLSQLVDARTREMRLALDSAEAANRAKSEFLTNMSHELRTPMHAIIAYTKLGLEKLGAGNPQLDKLAQNLSRIDQSAARLLALLNDLLDLSKLESGKMHYQMEITDLSELATAVANEFHAIASMRKIKLIVDGIGPCKVFCDKTRIGQVIRNLVSNAIKFTPEGTHVRISTDHDRLPSLSGEDPDAAVEAVRLSVKDEGVGIPEGELESVFDKFVQSSKTKTGSGGTGLGLSISREIVAAHGGRIWAHNNPQVGATVHLVIPCNQAVADNAGTSPAINHSNRMPDASGVGEIS
jgi:PAS domain S-box-containing protein